MFLPLPQLFVRAILYKLFIFNIIPCFVRGKCQALWGREELDSFLSAWGGGSWSLHWPPPLEMAPQRSRCLNLGPTRSPFLVLVLGSRTSAPHLAESEGRTLTAQNVEVWERPEGSSPWEAGQSWASVSPAVWFSASASWVLGGGAGPGGPWPNRRDTHCGQDVLRFGGRFCCYFQ